MRQSQTAVLERNVEWQGQFTIEPYETAWATEAIYFVRVLGAENLHAPFTARVQISPDGIHWCDEGTQLTVAPDQELGFCRVNHFGGWLRAVGELPAGASVRIIAYLVLKE